MITVRYFASLREKLGAQEQVQFSELPVGCTVGGLRDWLCERSTVHAQAFESVRAVRAACDQVMCDDDEPLRDGVDVAFFPPVTGG